VNLLNRSLALTSLLAFASACSGGGSSPGPAPTSTASPSSTYSEAAFKCPSSDSDTAAVAVPPPAAMFAANGRRPSFSSRRPSVREGALEVTYDLATLGSSRPALAARESALGARVIREFDFNRIHVATRVVAVPPAQSAAIAAKLRTEAGVRRVVEGIGLRYPQTVTTGYFPNDPYFDGFANPIAPSGSAVVPPPTNNLPPYYESEYVPGQWNLHAVQLEHAFAYSQPGNGSGVTNAGALGSASVKIAVIDTGEDSSQEELKAKIVYQKCFITDPNGNQSTSKYTTDEYGHGTDVAGIAAGATGNGVGFSSAGAASVIYGYRIEATPDDNCANPDSTDVQCEASTADIADAIGDAVAQNVNVINLSIGGGFCSSGIDPSSLEGNAVANAIASNIVVVAAAGNDDGTSTYKGGTTAPACDAGVIAAGATALGDGQPNGSGTSTGSASAPVEYVASYSDYGSPGSAYRSPTAWGIVAPGGDPTSAGGDDPDLLHWIDDIWTSTPFDKNFEATSCGPDYPATGSTDPSDCRVLIAGTSMASPEVAGVAALIIAANPTYQDPAKMKTLLCSTADQINDSKEGCGRLNAYRAMAVAVADPVRP
jgi:subtilisin family serine protease